MVHWCLQDDGRKVILNSLQLLYIVIQDVMQERVAVVQMRTDNCGRDCFRDIQSISYLLKCSDMEVARLAHRVDLRVERWIGIDGHTE